VCIGDVHPGRCVVALKEESLEPAARLLVDGRFNRTVRFHVWRSVRNLRRAGAVHHTTTARAYTTTQTDDKVPLQAIRAEPRQRKRAATQQNPNPASPTASPAMPHLATPRPPHKRTQSQTTPAAPQRHPPPHHRCQHQPKPQRKNGRMRMRMRMSMSMSKSKSMRMCA